jgi:hypothetical protein
MKSTYVSASQIHWGHDLFQLEPVSFNEALEDYYESMKGQRIRAKAYRFNGTGLAEKLNEYYPEEFRRTSAGLLLAFVYKGIPMDVTVDGRGQYFRLCEDY